MKHEPVARRDRDDLSPSRLAHRRVTRTSVAVRDRGRRPDLALRTVVLDLGGVVMPTLFEVVDDPAFPAGPFGHDPAYDDVESGRLQEREYWARLGANRPDLDLGGVMRTRVAVRHEMRTLLAELRGRVRVAALTNDMAHWFGPRWPTRFPEFVLFDDMLEAARAGVLKPDPAVFRWALRELRTEPGTCLLVDDLPSNLRGAAAVGMATEHFSVTDPAGSVRRILERLGIRASASPRGVFTSTRGQAP